MISPFRVLCSSCRTACPPPRGAEDWNTSSAPASAPRASTVLQTDLPSGNTRAVAASTRNRGQALPYTDALARCARRCMVVWAERRSRVHLCESFSPSPVLALPWFFSLFWNSLLWLTAHITSCALFILEGATSLRPAPQSFLLKLTRSFLPVAPPEPC